MSEHQSFQTLLDHNFTVESSNYLHDPDGDDIQMHDPNDGSEDVIFSFSDRLIQSMDLQPGDVMKFEGDAENPSTWRLINKSAEDRKQEPQWIEP